MSKKIFCSGGCSAKLGAGLLSNLINKLPAQHDENLLVGFQSSDDASVYKLTDDIAIVQTLDFFPPMVDNPYIFGQIAAANALSDIYAMGGTVKTALNIVCFPENDDINILGEILSGGLSKVQEAGGILTGGHSISDKDIKYGLSVTGTIHPDKIFKNNTPKSGDVLVLTKPLGVGIVTTAGKVEQASESSINKAIKSMTTLNKYASEIFQKYDVSACTDVTGFGLLGHLKEMLSDMSAIIYSGNIPYIKEAFDYANEFLITGGGQKNRNYVGDNVNFNGIDFAMEEILFDPQTSGGLLGAVNPKDLHNVISELSQLSLPFGIIGEIVENSDYKIIVEKGEKKYGKIFRKERDSADYCHDFDFFFLICRDLCSTGRYFRYVFE